MKKTQINPWTWQDQRGFSQAWKVEGGQTVIFVSGQVSVSADGQPMHAGDFGAQTRLVLENLRSVLERAGASLDHVVKLGVFLTDMSRLPEFGRIKAEFFKGPQPASTAVGVNALALPAFLIEVEAFAVL
jgi:enamine deaminase RidA (YjgF/YER057c/UK114 family)